MQNHEKCPDHCSISCLYPCRPICCKLEIPIMTVPRVLPTQVSNLASYPSQSVNPSLQNSHYQSFPLATESLLSKCHPSCLSQCAAWCNPICCSYQVPNYYNNYLAQRNYFPSAVNKRNIIPTHKKKTQMLERDIIERTVGRSLQKHSLRRKKEAFEVLDNF